MNGIKGCKKESLHPLFYELQLKMYKPKGVDTTDTL